MKQNSSDQRLGFHSIESILIHNPEKIKKILLPANRDDSRIMALTSLIESKGISYELSKKISQEPEAIIKKESLASFQDLKKIISERKDSNPLILILDNIIDPRNLGACVRSAAVCGVDFVIINKHHCAPTNAIAHKVSAGGFEVLDIFHVTNLVNCIKYLKENGIQILGLSEHSGEVHYEEDLRQPTALIMGSEETGVRQKTLEICDSVISLSGNPYFKSLNVSVATGVILNEALRQRHQAKN
jgi:23S rRNA (guanosine2251-2'-O)-methyltransferase